MAIRQAEAKKEEGDMSHRWIACLAVAMISTAGAAPAKEEFCVKAKEDLKGKTFTAKVPLFQTKIWPDEIRELERDSEEIRQGAKTIVKDVGCGAKRIEVTLRPDGPGEEVEIYFYISREGRLEPGAREDFDRMLTFVFEDVSEAGESD